MAQLAGLADFSARCEQFIKYECYSAFFSEMMNAGGYHVTMKR